MYLIFDTETTGLPKNYQAPLSDFTNWPRLVQLAWQTYDQDGNLWEKHNYIIRPDGFVIPAAATKIHRISHEKALAEGKDLREILSIFADHIKRASFLVGHNISFDEKIMGAEFLRHNISNPLEGATKICTMKASVDFCALDNGRDNGFYKWPSLSELHLKLFKVDFTEAHDADIDVTACARCFFELKSRGVLNKLNSL
ncbi:MAG: 3'-5' exonuclease [Candidatus Falkowbacteria bacterium]|nr:3'-5' exonuclease [Candidatus Falkowbacteria bacterium]